MSPDPPHPLGTDGARLHRAIAAARNKYPRDVADVLCDYITGWQDFGYRFERGSLTGRLVAHLLGEQDAQAS